MNDRGMEPLVDKFQKSALPTEFKRMKDLIKQLSKQHSDEDAKCKQLMEEIIAKKQQG